MKTTQLGQVEGVKDMIGPVDKKRNPKKATLRIKVRT